MFKINTDTLVLIGQNDISFSFKMCEFDRLEDIDDAVKSWGDAGLYIFAYKYSKPNDPRYWYSLKYIGETENYSSRNYSDHHKKEEIENAQANSWGYCIVNDTNSRRKEYETDLISKYNPPCNG